MNVITIIFVIVHKMLEKKFYKNYYNILTIKVLQKYNSN